MSIPRSFGDEVAKGKLFNVTLIVPGTLATGDGQAKWKNVLGRVLKLVGVSAFLGNTGGTSGSTDLQVRTGTTDLLSAALSIAYNDSDKVGSTNGVAATTIARDAVVEIDIDAVPGAASSNLTVNLVFEVV